MIIVDAHVHIYDCFDLELLFDSAYANMKSEANRYRRGATFTAVLMLAETSHHHWFEKLKGYAQERVHKGRTIGSWSFQFTQEPASLYANTNQHKEIVIIAGRQIVTAENQEVLALGTEKNIRDRYSLVQTVKAIQYNEAIPVIPYGFGKWTGTRGKLINELFNSTGSQGIFLGDNGGRPRFFPLPSLFNLSDEKRRPILPGSDPLRLNMESSRAGSFGFILEGALSKERPFEELKKRFTGGNEEILVYGRPMNPLRFIFVQLALRLARLSYQGRNL